MILNRLTSSDSPERLAFFPYGVGHGDEGVCLLIQMGPHRILLDCGLADIQPLQQETSEFAELVFCSHAHRDHARGLLALSEAFPDLKVYTSEVTAKLLALDASSVNSQSIPIFCHPLKWRTPLALAADLTLELVPAGHLPGAAAAIFTYKTPARQYKILYTGDFSLSNLQLAEGLSVEALRGLAPDVLIIEGSYGTTRHPHRRQQEKQLMDRMTEAIANSQSILLPVPTLGLGQEILKLLRSHHQFTGKDLDIWVDGNIAKACDIYLELLSQLPLSVQNFAKHQPLFWDERVCPRMYRLNLKKRPWFNKFPCIVLTDRLNDWQKYCLPEANSWLILVPEHYKNRNVFDKLPDFIEVETYLLAEHSDGRNTTQLIHNLRPQHVIFVHGSPTYLADLTGLEELRNRYQLHCPGIGTLVELPIGDRFIQPAPTTQAAYEGEIAEMGSFITITLPESINNDPRWNNFADTGLLEARWQGEELVLRGLSPKELLSQSNDSRRLVDLDCCKTCRYYRSQRCWNQASPLYGFKVTAEGYCPVFEPFTSYPESQ
jgi:Cft2 family RNA processing exonuclease